MAFGAIVMVALAGLASITPTQAQECSGIEESYIGNLPGCVNPPQTEEECAIFRDERLETKFWRSQDQISQITTLYNDALKVSDEIFVDEQLALTAIWRERRATAKGVAAAPIVAVDLIPTPGNIAAAAECLGWYTLKMAAIITGLNRAYDDIQVDFDEAHSRIEAEASLREENITARRGNTEITGSVSTGAHLNELRTLHHKS